MSKARKQSGKSGDHAEIFSDEDFDADDFVEQMDEHRLVSQSRVGLRRLEEMRELRELKMALDDWGELDE